MAAKKTYRKRKNNSLSDEEKKVINSRYEELIWSFNDGVFGDYIHVDMEKYFHLLFERQGQVRLQEQGKEHYNDGHYNAIIRKIAKGSRESHLYWIVTDTLDGIHQYSNAKFAIVSPVTYIGKTRNIFGRKEESDGSESADKNSFGNARYLFAMTVDLDDVSVQNMKYLQFEIDHGRYAEPTMIVTTGSGLHLYYCFEKPIRITMSNMGLLNRLKCTLTRSLWDYGMTTRKQAIEIHDINQGYRFPGTQTKTGRIVSCYTRHYDEPLFYTPSSLNEFIKYKYKNRPDLFGEDVPLSDSSTLYLDGKRGLNSKEQKELEKDVRLPAHWSKNTARQMFGDEWFEAVKENGSVDWQKYPEALYQYWHDRLFNGGEVHVGHRYWCIWVLSAWAWNCKIPYSRLQADAYALMERFTAIPDDKGQNVPFTVRDCNAAMSIYREHKQRGEWKPIRLSRRKIVQITGLALVANKRNFRSRAEHIRLMNGKLKYLHDETLGGDGIETRGRLPKDYLVRQWRDKHPGVENKSLCAKELGISRHTVIRWWDADHEPIAYGANRVVAITSATMPVVSVEKILLLLGFPEAMIPIIKPQIEKSLGTKEFWEQYKSTNPMESWSQELKDYYSQLEFS